jgi:hypothetical protein
MSIPDPNEVVPIQARTSRTGPNSHIKHHDPSADRYLLQLPLEAAPRHVPPAAAAADHLHVVAGNVPDVARLDHCLELAERIVEEIVLHHPQDAGACLRRIQDPLRAGEFVAQRLLGVDVPALVEHLEDALFVQRDRQEAFHRVDLNSARRQLCHGRERGRIGPVCLALLAALGVRIDERDHLDVGVPHVAAHVEVVDPAQAGERGADGPVVRNECHRCRLLSAP